MSEPRPSTSVLHRNTHSHTSGYDSENTERSRDALYVDHPSIKTVKIVELLDAIFDDISPETLKSLTAEVLPTLKAAPPPRKATVAEGAAYTLILPPVIKLVESCLSKLVSGFRPSISLLMTGTVTFGSDIFATHKPDCVTVLARHLWTTSELGAEEFVTGGKHDYMQIPTVWELKKSSQPEADRLNVRQMVWGVHHLLRNDPRRRSAIGVAIADDHVRVTYHDRSNIVVSQDFSMRSPLFVRLLASLVTATREQLGYDDTVKFVMFKVIDTEQTVRVWDYQVHDDDGVLRVFRTICRITDNGTDALTGRGNRVWKVVEVVDGKALDGPSFALKDAWLECDRLPEYKVLEEIQKSLGEDPRRRHLLKVEHAGQVRLSNGKGDTTNAAVCDLKRFQAIRLKDDLVLKLNAETTSRNSSTSLPDKSTYPPPLQPEIHHGKDSPLRRHDRTVSEFGEVVSDMRRYELIFYTLHGALCALSAYHDAGWIHRDVSPHNILLVKRLPGDSEHCRCHRTDCPARFVGDEHSELVAVLMDVEFALKTSSDDPHHTVRSGTLNFMSRDVIERSWDFGLLPDDLVYKFPPRLPFCQNVFDDIQSFLWILVWILLYSFLGGSLADELPSDIFADTYRTTTGFYDRVSTRIPALWSSPHGLVQLLRTALPDSSFERAISSTGDFHKAVRQAQRAGLTEAYSVQSQTVDVTKFAGHTLPAIEAGQNTMRTLLRATTGDTALGHAEFKLKVVSRSLPKEKQVESIGFLD